jgi:hypothetical protein
MDGRLFLTGEQSRVESLIQSCSAIHSGTACFSMLPLEPEIAIARSGIWLRWTQKATRRGRKALFRRRAGRCVL